VGTEFDPPDMTCYFGLHWLKNEGGRIMVILLKDNRKVHNGFLYIKQLHDSSF